jgi:hypothetical protein
MYFFIALHQRFSTYGCWQPTKYNNRKFGDPFMTIIVLGFSDPKV